ncbi:hypothetical protein NE236_26900 [Actinoallomurus purpureus]|jgi:hypothetical protein|uniref:hypothetical protein n=1 Tax=Actinoallomurus purpureus TaxID=478114 RepID=UPI002093B3FF|nr:hypothetical protein [Actinoallomurus purpureus]MCO6008607.1 hypothetical protein [Actinoallomurus purpureus]
MWTMLAIFVALAVLGPLAGADSRDGLDWARNNFWLRRRTALKAATAQTPETAGRTRVREHRTVPAAR